ncbi:MAG: nitroreductase family protein [Fervidobacterium sp.]|nr:nitroreductase family protein [Fervidobacterium sp.]
MDILEVVQKRRSIRLFSEKDIPDEILYNIVKYSLLAPSGRNLKPVELVVIKNKDTIKKIMKTREGAFSFLKTAPVCIVVTANQESGTWISDSSIVASYIQLLAVNFGLGSCWGHAHERYHDGKAVEEEIKTILGIPSNFGVLCVIGMGYPSEEKPFHTLEEVDKSRIHFEKW